MRANSHHLNRFIPVLLAVWCGTALAGSTAIPESRGPLIEAVSIPYTDMGKAGIERNKYDYDCCNIFSAPGTPKSESHYSPKKAFFVRVKIDARALGSHMFQNSCKPKSIFSSSTECEQDELNQLVTDSIKRGQIGDLYSKYRAGFAAFEGKAQIRNTEKFGGFQIYKHKRTGEIDELIVGPMPGKPTLLVLTPGLGAIQVEEFNP